MKETLKNYVCEICGGELREIEEGHFQCPYCRAEFFKETSLPDELVLDLHSAGRARSLQRFEDALSEYDRIIAAYPECFDAYWGATLSDYGIQYEKDYDGRMIPTVHRFSETSVFENSYYVNAVKCCKDTRELERIKSSAEEIERIRTEIKKTVGVQEPYDIFLCYKETSVSNPKDYTPEFYWAVDLYGKLMGLGYRVFFAKQSLPASKGDYEAHIFPALSSAKLMLILTTDVSHVESVWVKNEWSRFIRFSKEDPNAGKRFKVIMRGFKPEQLPRELRKEQALNQDSLDWVEQLYAVIADTFRDKKKEEEERRKREADEQAAYFARMLEEERKKWAAEEQRKQAEERERRASEEQKKREEEERKRAEEFERKAKEEERIRELERKLSEERQRNVAVTAQAAGNAALSVPTSEKTEDTSEKTRESAGSTGLGDAKETVKEIAVKAEQNAPADDGKHLCFGSYPQDRVTDEKLINELNGLAGKLPVKTNSYGWTAYKYAWDKNGSTLKLMWYIDIGHGGEKYRGVYFISYRSLYTQSANGYSINNVYWFKFMPISWRVLEKKSGKTLLHSEKLLDSHEFYYSDAARKISGTSIYANNYEKSSVRAFLNESFSETAFSTEEIGKITVSTVSCAASTTGTVPNKYAGGSVKDKLFLLSGKDVVTPEYGFSSDGLANDSARERVFTDYALCQGGTAGENRWWLRSPSATYEDRAIYVGQKGFARSGETVYFKSYGVCPAMWINEGGDKKGGTGEDKTVERPSKTTDRNQKRAAEDPNEPKIGDFIKFGKYRQSDKTDSARVIDWQILDKKDGKALVISKFALDGKKFHEVLEAATWETCTLRRWLNGEFISSAFSEAELAAIPTVTVAAHKNPTYDSYSGKPTEDKVFLLSVKEANTYFKTNKAAACMPTTYAKSKGATEFGECRWWLRTIGEKTGRITYVNKFIGIDCKGEPNNSTGMAVRPAMWIDLGKINQEDKKSSRKTDGKTDSGVAEYIEKGLAIGLYKGYAIKDVPNGKGTMVYKNGDVYEGEFSDGKPNGKGKCSFKNGNVYEGDFALGVMHGKGKLIDVSGFTYEGDFENGVMNGTGKMTYKDGTVEEGKFLGGVFKGGSSSAATTPERTSATTSNAEQYIERQLKDGAYKGYAINGVPNGKGTMTYVGGSSYEGEWKNGKYSGKGKKIYNDGTLYDGDWADGVRNGKGRYTFTNGDVYEGDWVNGERHGKGKLTFKDGRIYEGDFIKNDCTGSGKMFFTSGEIYEGKWKNNTRHGQGKMTFENGEVYEGQWADDRRTGKGKMTYNEYDGVYEGEWFKDVWSGKGKFSSRAGVYEGMFQNGNYSGNGKMTYSNGTVYEGSWVNGKKEGMGKEINRLSNTTYEGEWKNGFRDGKGKLIFYNGSFYEGEWEQNSIKGKGKMTYKNGKVEKGRFVNGVFKKTLF